MHVRRLGLFGGERLGVSLPPSPTVLLLPVRSWSGACARALTAEEREIGQARHSQGTFEASGGPVNRQTSQVNQIVLRENRLFHQAVKAQD